MDDEADRAALDRAVQAALFAQSPIGLHLLDTRLRLVRVSAAARLIRDFPLGRLVGRSLPEVLEACNVSGPEHVERTLREVLETGRPVRDLLVHARSRRRAAAQAVVSVACFRLQDPDGTVLGVAVAINDITARARAEAGLRLLNRAATGVGTTLDILRTAQEVCDLAVPELADTMAVDVLDSVLRGEAPEPAAVLENAPLRRGGFRSVADPSRQGVPAVGEVGTYPFGTPYRQALADLAPVLIRRLAKDADWLDPDRRRDARLLAAGVHSMMVVPMRARGVVLGLACLYRWHTPTPFERTDLALAEQLTSMAALCLDNARLYSRERSVARILQRELRQGSGSGHAAVETAHAYLPAGTGGGWFDVIPLSGARVALTAGDTTGSLVNAAEAMGELRAALAALSDLDLPPDEILERLHDLAGRPHREAEADRAWPASCLYAVYDPVTRICTLSSAGHPRPSSSTPTARSSCWRCRRAHCSGEGPPGTPWSSTPCPRAAPCCSTTPRSSGPRTGNRPASRWTGSTGSPVSRTPRSRTPATRSSTPWPPNSRPRTRCSCSPAPGCSTRRRPSPGRSPTRPSPPPRPGGRPSSSSPAGTWTNSSTRPH
ncbi:hypothetical protein GCM10025734_09320 [Kitasatospora paranensis]